MYTIATYTLPETRSRIFSLDLAWHIWMLCATGSSLRFGDGSMNCSFLSLSLRKRIFQECDDNKSPPIWFNSVTPNLPSERQKLTYIVVFLNIAGRLGNGRQINTVKAKNFQVSQSYLMWKTFFNETRFWMLWFSVNSVASARQMSQGVRFRTSTAPAICFTQSCQKALQARPLPLKYSEGLALLNRVSRQNHWFDR